MCQIGADCLGTGGSRVTSALPSAADGSAPAEEGRIRSAIVERPVRPRDRQARVGILRNTNGPPEHPPRRVALMGRWPSLRSARRASPERIARLIEQMEPDGLGAAVLAGGTRHDSRGACAELFASSRDRAPTVRIDDDGRIAGVDIDELVAAVRKISAPESRRRPFGAEYRVDIRDATPPPRPGAPPLSGLPEPAETTSAQSVADTEEGHTRGPGLRHAFRYRFAALLVLASLLLAAALLEGLNALMP